MRLRCVLLFLAALAPVAQAESFGNKNTHSHALHELDGHGFATEMDAPLRELLSAVARPKTLQLHLQQHASYVNISLNLSNNVASDCDRALARWETGLSSFEQWALQMADASSKSVTGVLYGNVVDLGNFDECINVAVADDVASFTGQYGLLVLDIQAGPNSSAATSNSSSFRTALSVRLAACFPSTCSASEMEAALCGGLQRANAQLESKGLRLQVSLPEETTSVGGQWWRPPALAEWLVLTLCCFLCLLVGVGTVVDIAISSEAKLKRRKVALLLAFSAWTNGKRLMHVAPPSDSNFPCIGGIRYISTMWVITFHRYRFPLAVPFTNLITMSERVSDPTVMVIVNAPLAVDTFFLIGGFLSSYAFMKATRARNRFNFLSYYVHRYVRLTPAFAMVVAVTATWLPLVDSGPLWYNVVGGASDSCRRHWWTALLYVANYVNPLDQCMMQSWYLMVDMQLHWLSPLVLVPLWKWGRLGVAWLAVVLAVSCAVPFAVAYVSHFRSPVSTELSAAAQDFFMETMYYPTHTRFTSFVCGILAGYLLFLIKTGQTKWKLGRIHVIIGWLVSIALCLTVVLADQPLFDPAHHAYNSLESSFFLGFYRLAWSVAVSWIILACILGHGGPVNALLSTPPMVILGRLTYGIYLTHAAIQLVDVGTMRTSDYYSNFRTVEKTISDGVLATFLGACLSLFVEIPLGTIENIWRSQSRGKEKERPAAKPTGTTGAATANDTSLVTADSHTRP